jgi:quinol monooxygenase YgiN
MSVLIVGKFAGDTAKFRAALTERAGEFAEISERSKAAGCLHHRFGIGDGVVMIVDEWESAESFGQFFGNPELQEFIGSVGAEPGPPELTITDAVNSADQF